MASSNYCASFKSVYEDLMWLCSGQEKRKERLNFCWRVLSVILAYPVEGSAVERHIARVCDFAVFSTLNIVCAGFIFVKSEMFL